MKRLWSKKVISSDLWEPEYEGVFCSIHDKVHFCFKELSGIAVLAEDVSIPQRLFPEVGKSAIPLPSQWILLEDVDNPQLFLNRNLVLNLRDMTFTSTPDLSVLKQYRAACKPEKYYVEASFVHGEYCITHKGQWGYECIKNGVSIWDFTGQGYLYTDICRWNDRFYFGTAGRGGYFYVLNTETGDVISAIKTGGTTSVVRTGSECYILSNEGNAVLLCVDLEDGHIKESIQLPGKAAVSSKLCLIDGNIHATTFAYKRKGMKCAIWNCVKIQCEQIYNF